MLYFSSLQFRQSLSHRRPPFWTKLYRLTIVSAH